MNQMNRYPEITAETPLEVVRDIHRYIWDYTIKHGEKPDECPYASACVLCEYARKRQIACGRYMVCYYCPAEWRTISNSKTCHDIYGDWHRECKVAHGVFGFNKKAHIAKKIRDVIFKKECSSC